MKTEVASASADKLKLITISIPDGMVLEIDRLAATKNFHDPSARSSRSSMIREALNAHFGWVKK